MMKVDTSLKQNGDSSQNSSNFPDKQKDAMTKTLNVEMANTQNGNLLDASHSLNSPDNFVDKPSEVSSITSSDHNNNNTVIPDETPASKDMEILNNNDKDSSQKGVKNFDIDPTRTFSCDHDKENVLFSNSETVVENAVSIQSEGLDNKEIDSQSSRSESKDQNIKSTTVTSVVESGISVEDKMSLTNYNKNSDITTPHQNKILHSGLHEPSLDTISESETRTDKSLELAVPGLVSPAPIEPVENGSSPGHREPNKVVTTAGHSSVDTDNGAEVNLEHNRITPDRSDEQIRLETHSVKDRKVTDGGHATSRHEKQNGAKCHPGLSNKVRNGRPVDKVTVQGVRNKSCSSSALVVTPSCTSPRQRNTGRGGQHFQPLRKSNSQLNLKEIDNSKNYYQSSRSQTNSSSRSSLHSSSIKLSCSRESVSRFEKPFTKLELSRALPRKSFFNCHEKSLKDAGIDTDDPKAKIKAERLKARLERISLEFNPLPSKPQVYETTPGVDNGQVVVSVKTTDINPAEPVENKEVENEKVDHEEVKNPSEPVDANGHTEARVDYCLRVPGKRRRPGSERPEFVDCKPLALYLEYVKDNKHEYQQYVRNSRPSRTEEPVTRLVKLGQIFEFRHRGCALATNSDDTELVMAAKALRPRSADPGKFCKSRDTKSANLWSHESSATLRQTTRPTSDDKRQQDKSQSTGTGPSTSGTQSTNTGTGKEDEHHKTELEKRKFKAEDWSRSVSTSTLTKAKVQSLKELGSDDKEVSKWWEAFSRCRYLRQSLPEVDSWR